MQPAGIGPRGLKSLALWQVDVLHIASTGRHKYVHVKGHLFSFSYGHSNDGGEGLSCHYSLKCFVIAGVPCTIRTDNGPVPAHFSSTFKQFCLQWKIQHVTGIPHSPQGQTIVERAHKQLKGQLIDMGMGRWACMGLSKAHPQHITNMALFTLIFLKTDDKGNTSTHKH